MSFRYILRYYIDPGFAEEKRIAELAELCARGQIEEVMFFYNPEELFQGYPGKTEQERWFGLAKRVRQTLTEHGVEMSVNPWTTTVHVSRGRKFSGEQRCFQPMIGENGVVSPITACPFDPHWQNQLSEFFARIAKEIAPTAIWIEDDWRLHNHEPSMNYGGCFCPLHLARFEQESGVKVTRESLLETILAPGEPHPWRKLWLKVCRDSLLEPARKIYEHVHAANPKVRLGLMSSLPDIHSVEGRDWNLLKEAFSPDAPLLVRPHLPPYTETFALAVSPAVARQTISEYDKPIEIYPELENSPRSGPYSKSGTFSLHECLHSALFGSSGITINHYDMMGNGLALDYDFPDHLNRAKPFLNALEELHLSDRNAEGIDVLYSPRIAEGIHAKSASSLFALQNNSISWSDLFFKLGVSHRLTRNIESERIRAVSGETLRAFSGEELRRLLAGPLILDACSAEILLEKGFGSDIGIASAEWRKLDDDGYAYEEITGGTESCYGVDAPRMSASRCSTELFSMRPEKDAEILSTIHRYDRSVLYPGSLLFRNSGGGTILTLAYPLDRAQFHMGFFNHFRRIFLQETCLRMGNGKNLLLGCERPLQVYRIRRDKDRILAFLNPTHDTYPEVCFRAPDLDLRQAELLQEDGSWHPAELTPQPDGKIRCRQILRPLHALVLKIKQA